MKISNEIKAKIISQYNGCEATTNYPNYKKCTIHGANIYGVNINSKEGFDIVKWKHKPKLLLKKLSNISDEDAIEVTKIVYGMATPVQQILIKEGIKSFFEQGWSINLKNMMKSLQYLQSKGYALPYMDYSVEDLVELGVYKLRQ